MKKKESSIAANYFYNLAYKIIAILVPVVTTPYISRVLGAEAIGSYSFSQSIATYFSIFGIMGLNLYGQLKIAAIRNEDKASFSSAFWEIFFAKVITSVLSLLLYSVVVFSLAKYRVLLAIMSIMVVANIFDISWMFQGLEEFKSIAIKNTLIKFLSLLLIMTMVKTENHISLYALIIHGSTLLGNLALWIRIGKYTTAVQVSWQRVLMHIKASLIYFLPTIATTIYTSTDKIMLGFIVGSDYQNGIYEQAHKIEQVIVTIISSLSAVLLPRLTFLYTNGKEKLDELIANIIRIIGALEVPMMVGLFAVADVFIPVFLGEEFTECVGLIRVFSVLLLFSGLNTTIGDSCLIAQGKQSKYNLGVFSGALSNMLLNAVMIPYFGAYGAAVASLAAETIVFMFFLYFSKSPYLNVKSILKGWKKYVISAVPMGFLVWYIGLRLNYGITTLSCQVLAGVVLYVAALVLLKDDMIIGVLKKVINLKRYE